jgi:hypothetical protein
MKIILPDFLIIPYQLLEDKEMSLIDERLYGIIYWFTKLKNERCTASNVVLAGLVRTTPATIQNSMTKLEAKGFIKRIFKDKARRIRQEIIPLIVFSKVSPINDTYQKVSPTNDRVSPTNDTSKGSQVSPIGDQNKNINTKKNNKEDSEAVASWGFSEELLKLKDSNRKDHKIIALYWKKKGWIFKNRDQFRSALKRELRAAGDLKGYTGEEIAKSIAFCQKEYPDKWTLETVFKRIQDLVNKKQHGTH